MYEKLTSQIDVASAARRNQVLSFELAADELSRLAEVTGGVKSPAVVDLRFSLFENKWSMVQLSARVTVRLLCQRSLEWFDYQLAIQNELVFAPEEALEDVPESIEVLSVEEADEEPKVWIEDSLLLALPLVPVRPDSKPVEYSVGEVAEVEEEKPNPFAKLKEMMKKE